MENKKKKLYVWLPLMLAVAFLGGVISQKILHADLARSDAEKKFSNILNMIRDQYVDPVDIDSLIEATIPGLLANLDPHSVYIPAEDLQGVNDELNGSFSGVGIQFTIVSDTLYVNEVVPDGPSEKAGVLNGDRIIKVDGNNVSGVKMSTDDIMKRLKGPKGTPVNITIDRPYVAEPVEVTVYRDDIPVQSVDAWYMATPTIGYIRVNKFGATTYQEFYQAMAELYFQGADDYIIDLRENGGGYMEMAVLMVNEFLDGGFDIVSTKGRNMNEDEVLKSDGFGNFTNSRVVVLIDEFSASASEIFAGAIQDNDRGIVVGRRSFGKGLVQRQIDLPDRSAIRLTIARYFTPSGRCIQKDYADAKSYETEILERYYSGEAFVEDSVHLENLPKFTTLTGRTVYGGGGIMPDVFVPNDTTGVTPYYTKVANAQIVQPFVRDFVESRKSTLSKAANLEELNKLLPTDLELLREFVEYAYKKAGINKQWAYINKSSDLIINQIKALIARNILGFNSFIEEYNKGDKTVLKAIEQIESGAADFPVSPPVTN